jgi:hypothetical protein
MATLTHTYIPTGFLATSVWLTLALLLGLALCTTSFLGRHKADMASNWAESRSANGGSLSCLERVVCGVCVYGGGEMCVRLIHQTTSEVLHNT